MYKILANTLFLGKKVIYMPSCHSTNDIALEMTRKSDITEGTVIITDQQKNGRGQRGNDWISEPGKNITMSIVLRPNFMEASMQFFLNMAISLAVDSTIKYYIPYSKCYIKWPNDMLIDRKKIAGILIENGLSGRNLDFSVVGIGLNVNQSAFIGLSATSFKNQLGQEVSLPEIYERLIHYIESYYLKLKAYRFKEIKDEYLKSLFGYRLSLRYRAEFEFEGVIEDVTDSGLLCIYVNGGTKFFDFKEIEFMA